RQIVGPGTAVIGDTGQAEAVDLRRWPPVEIPGDKQIQPSIAIVIEEGRARAPAFARDASLRGHITKMTPSVVFEQHVRSEIGDVEIDRAVVVEVAGRDAHPVAADARAALGGDVLERA